MTQKTCGGPGDHDNSADIVESSGREIIYLLNFLSVCLDSQKLVIIVSISKTAILICE